MGNCIKNGCTSPNSVSIVKVRVSVCLVSGGGGKGQGGGGKRFDFGWTYEGGVKYPFSQLKPKLFRSCFAKLNPLKTNSDLSQTSHYNIKSLSVREVVRIENMIMIF